LLNFYFTSIYYKSIHRFYLHSKLDCSKKLVSVTRIIGTIILTGYVILNYGECHNCVVITNAHATSILTCDRIASHNSPDVNVKTKVAGNVPHDKLSGMMTLSEETDLTKLRNRFVGKILHKTYICTDII
jgi:hypothetical protein